MLYLCVRSAGEDSIAACTVVKVRSFLQLEENVSTTPVTSGVPQGSVLKPLSPLIYINDLPSQIVSSIKLFADDCVLYRVITNIPDCAIL